MGNCINSVLGFFHSSFLSMENSSTSIPPRHQEEPQNAFGGIVAQASPSSSTVRKKGPWDVFINHRGCDTKHKLASSIYHTLDLVGVRAFLDEEEIEKGGSIPHEIQEGMRTSGLHIAVLSERYAESPWCLAELSFMHKTATTILPVFYHVKPDDLRWVEKGVYAPAFSQHEKKGRYPSSMLEDWKSALQKVSYLSGYILNSHNDDEGKLLKSIVNYVLGTMKKAPLEVAKHPVGMDEIVKDFERSQGKSIEGEQHVQIAGIVGFGGAGKTTLATELYNRKSSSFTHFSFLHDVRDAASKNALHTKQKKLLEDLRIQSPTTFDNVKEGKAIVADRLKGLRVLIVLDDVDHEDQADALLPSKESLGSGSLVIVTTREGGVLTKWGITSIYEMQPLQRLHARKLFCWDAFLQPFPQEGFEVLVEDYIDACKGLPLSLKVIGGQLYGKRSKDYWVSQLNKIRRILPKEILERLKVSYDTLDEDEKVIFLDVACFFIGIRVSSAIAVWDGSGWSGLCSWETLLNKCLVEVDKEENIRMHDHLRDLGRQIAMTEHTPLRFWSPGQSMRIQRGITIRGILAATDQTNELPFQECKEMMIVSNVGVGLQLVDVRGNDFTEECAKLSRGLLWLRWLHFKHKNIPSWLSLENIRVLEFKSPWNLKALWEDANPPLELRELLLNDATELESLPRSIGRLKHLKRLSLNGEVWSFRNERLSSLPDEFCGLQSLEHLVLTEFKKLSSLPNRFGDLVNLRRIDFQKCESLKMLPVSFKQLINLEYLNLSGCYNLTLEADILENITNLKVFDVSYCREIKVLPASIDQLSKLKELKIEYLPLLTRLPKSFGNLSYLVTLRLVNCAELYEMPSLAGVVSLKNLYIQDCPKIKKIEGLEHLTSLEKLRLWTEWMEPGIHSLRCLKRLRTLNLQADNITAFEACIESIEMENWPRKMTISGSFFSDIKSILDSFTFPDLVVENSLDFEDMTEDEYPEEPTTYYSHDWSLRCEETNLSCAAIACYLVHSPGSCVVIRSNRSRVRVRCGDSIVISVFREVSPLITEDSSGQRFLQVCMTATGQFWYGSGPLEVDGGWLIVGERGSVLGGIKKLFQTFCKPTSTS